MRYLLAALCLAIATPLLAAPANTDTPLAAPGLHVPLASIPYALDEYQGKPELVPIHHSTVSVNNHNGANFAGELAGSYFFKPKVTIELAGPHARVQLHSAKPVLYLHMETDTDSSGDSANSDVATWTLVRAKIKKSRRVLSKINFTQLTGHAKRSEGVVDSEVKQLSGGWVRITPRDPLTSGEYALMPVPRIQSTFSSAVFDFGINPSAPEPKDALIAQP